MCVLLWLASFVVLNEVLGICNVDADAGEVMLQKDVAVKRTLNTSGIQEIISSSQNAVQGTVTHRANNSTVFPIIDKMLQDRGSLVICFLAGLLAAIVISIIIAARTSQESSVAEPEESFRFVRATTYITDITGISEDPDGNVEDFERFADQNELDIYTCVALSISSGRGMIHLLPRLCITIILQFFLPICLLLYQIRYDLRWTPPADDMLFGIMGLILYGYSIWHIYNGSFDECRTLVMGVALDWEVEPITVCILFLGELQNVFVATVLTLTVYLMFCGAKTAIDLFLCCVAINFVGEVDNEIVNSFMAKDAIADLRSGFDHWRDRRKAITSESTGQHGLRLYLLCSAIRMAGTVGIGVSTIVFGFVKIVPVWIEQGRFGL